MAIGEVFRYIQECNLYRFHESNVSEMYQATMDLMSDCYLLVILKPHRTVRSSSIRVVEFGDAGFGDPSLATLVNEILHIRHGKYLG